MEIINKNILNLLSEHDCVIVPHFGGFVASYHAALLNFDNNTMQPPHKNVLFNKNLFHNDGLLATSVAKSMHVSMQEAAVEIQNYVNLVNAALQINKRIELFPLGILYADNNQNIQFIPNKSASISLDSYGLPVFKITPTLKSLSIPEVELNNVRSIKTKNTFNYKRIAAAAILIPAIAILSWLPSNYTNSKYNFAHLLSFTKSKPTEVLIVKHNTERIHTLARLILAEKKITNYKVTIDSLSLLLKKSNELKKSSSPIIEKTNLYNNDFILIAGCFGSIENANALVKKLQESGYTQANILPKTNSLYRVCYSVHSNKIDVQKAQELLLQVNLESWILKSNS